MKDKNSCSSCTVYIHCSCHELQLAGIHAVNSYFSAKRMFGTVLSLILVLLFHTKCGVFQTYKQF